MFSMATNNPRQMVAFILAVSKITDEIRLRVTPNEVRFRGMDSAHVSMIDFNIPKDYFSDYKVEKETIVSVLLEKLTGFLKGVKRGEVLEVTLEEGGGKLKVRRFVGTHVKNFMIPLLDVGEAAELGLPKVDFPVTFKLTCSVLEGALKDVSQITDKVKFSALEDEFQIRGESDEGYETVVSLKYESAEIIDKNVKEEASAVYNVEILSGVIREMSRISEIATLSFGTDLPLRLRFDFSEGGRFDFYLAPRIE